MDEAKKLEAVEWLKQNLVPRKVNGQLTFDCSARSIWERAGRPTGQFRVWWLRTKKCCNLKEGQDFGAGRPKCGTTKKDTRSKDYLLAADAAKVVMMGDDSEAGLALRWALVDLLNRVEAGDPELIDDTLRRVASPEQVERHIKTGHERIVDMYLRQGKSPEWIAQRLQEASQRNAFTGVLEAHGVVGDGVADITTDMFRELFGASASELQEGRGVPMSRPARDGLTLVERAKKNLVEVLSMEKLDEKEAQGNRQCRDICIVEARKVAQIR